GRCVPDPFPALPPYSKNYRFYEFSSRFRRRSRPHLSEHGRRIRTPGSSRPSRRTTSTKSRRHISSAATDRWPGTLQHMPSAAGDISRPDRNDIVYVDPDENGVSPWPTVGLARVDAAPGGDDKTTELAVVVLIVGSFGTLTEWFGV